MSNCAVTEISAGIPVKGVSALFFCAKMKIILDFLKDVYGRYGLPWLLGSLVVIVALVLIVAQVSGLSVEAIAKWLGGL